MINVFTCLPVVTKNIAKGSMYGHVALRLYIYSFSLQLFRFFSLLHLFGRACVTQASPSMPLYKRYKAVRYTSTAFLLVRRQKNQTRTHHVRDEYTTLERKKKRFFHYNLFLVYHLTYRFFFFALLFVLVSAPIVFGETVRVLMMQHQCIIGEWEFDGFSSLFHSILQILVSQLYCLEKLDIEFYSLILIFYDFYTLLPFLHQFYTEKVILFTLGSCDLKIKIQ